VARGDRLRGLAEAHVVGEQQASRKQEALHAFPLVGVEATFERTQLADGLEGRLLVAPMSLGPFELFEHERARRRRRIEEATVPCHEHLERGEQLPSSLWIDARGGLERLVRERTSHARHVSTRP